MSTVERHSAKPRLGIGRAQVSFLELFFDLAFVLAFADLSRFLADHLSWQGAARTLVLLLPMWWLWTFMSWMTSIFDTDKVGVQVAAVLVMAGALVMAVAVPHAYTFAGPIFAGAYLAALLGSASYFAFVRSDDALRRWLLHPLFWFAGTGVLWIVGAVLTGTAAEILWFCAAVVDYSVVLLRWPLPRAGRIAYDFIDLAYEHESERNRQFFIIALGEALLAAGVALAASRFDLVTLATFLDTFVTTALFARIYIYRTGSMLDEATWRRGAGTRLPTAVHLHLVMIAGLVVTAASDAVVIEDPLHPGRPAVLIATLGGPALFLLGRLLLDYLVAGRARWSHPVAVAVLMVAALPLRAAPLLVADVVTTLTLLTIAVTDTFPRYVHRPHRIAK